MNKQQIYNILAIISTLGILAWMLTDYFGGMLIYLLSYGLIIIPIIILYIVSFGNTIVSLAKRGFNQNKIKVIFHGLVILSIILTNIFQSDLLKSKRILTATLKDDQFNYTLVFQKMGHVKMKFLEYSAFKRFFTENINCKVTLLFFQKSLMTIILFLTRY